MKGMSGAGTRRFLQAVAAMLLVGSSLPCAAEWDNEVSPSTTVLKKQRADLIQRPVRRNNEDELETPGQRRALLEVQSKKQKSGKSEERGSMMSPVDRGTALLEEGKPKEAADVLQAAVAEMEEKVSSRPDLEQHVLCVPSPLPAHNYQSFYYTRNRT